VWWQRRHAADVQRLDMRVSVGRDLLDLGELVRPELLARLREQQRLQRCVRRLVQPQVHRHLDVHDDGRRERERGLFGRRDVSHHVHR